jgi:hypothetical protein
LKDIPRHILHRLIAHPVGVTKEPGKAVSGIRSCHNVSIRNFIDDTEHGQNFKKGLLKNIPRHVPKIMTAHPVCQKVQGKATSYIGTCCIVALRNFMDVIEHNSQFQEKC